MSFSLCGIGSVETYGDAICINYLRDDARGLGIALWDRGGHGHIARITASSFSKIRHLGGRLSSAIMLWISIQLPRLVDDWELQAQPAEAVAVRKNQHRKLKVLIQWLGMTDFECSTGSVEDIKLSFPSFTLRTRW